METIGGFRHTHSEAVMISRGRVIAAPSVPWASSRSNRSFDSETSNEWISERTGIEERHWVVEGETGATLATAAAQEAIERAGIPPPHATCWHAGRCGL
jgi:hypothetical protein